MGVETAEAGPSGAPPSAPPPDRRAADWLAVVLLAVPLAWLAVAAVVVDVELWDGWDAVVNAHHFAGGGDVRYVNNRAPLMGLLLAPAAAWARAQGLAPLDPRPYHAVSALLHAAYLGGVLWWLRRGRRRSLAPLAAFASAVLCLLFWSYAPFVSHDLAPGALLVVMVVLADRFRAQPRPGIWLALVACGAAAPLLKQTYALFWCAILAGLAISAAAGWRHGERPDPRPLVWLALGAAASAAIYWLATAAVLDAPAVPFLARPWWQVRQVGGMYPPGLFPWWVYLRNLPAYGVVAVAFLPLAMAAALRGSPRRRLAAGVWLFSAFALHLVPVREVRYLAFLAPLTAFLLVPVLEERLGHRHWRWLVAGLLAVDVTQGAVEAARVAQPFYRRSQARELLGAMAVPPREPLVVHQPLSLRPAGMTSFPGDRYHRLFHLAPHHLAALYRIPEESFAVVAEAERLAAMGVALPGARLLAANQLVTNHPGWRGNEQPGLDGLRIVFAEAVARETSGPWEWGPAGGHCRLAVPQSLLEERAELRLFPAVATGGHRAPLRPLGDGAVGALFPWPGPCAAPPETVLLGGLCVLTEIVGDPEAGGTRLLPGPSGSCAPDALESPGEG